MQCIGWIVFKRQMKLTFFGYHQLSNMHHWVWCKYMLHDSKCRWKERSWVHWTYHSHPWKKHVFLGMALKLAPSPHSIMISNAMISYQRQRVRPNDIPSARPECIGDSACTNCPKLDSSHSALIEDATRLPCLSVDKWCKPMGFEGNIHMYCAPAPSKTRLHVRYPGHWSGSNQLDSHEIPLLLAEPICCLKPSCCLTPQLTSTTWKPVQPAGAAHQGALANVWGEAIPPTNWSCAKSTGRNEELPWQITWMS